MQMAARTRGHNKPEGTIITYRAALRFEPVWMSRQVSD